MCLTNKLKGVSSERDAEKILQGMLDSDVLGGNFVGDDLKKKVRALIKKYHPDSPNHELVSDVRTAIIKRLGNLGDTKPRSNSTRQESQARENNGHNDQSKAKNTKPNYTHINETIQRAFNNFSGGNKSFANCISALNLFNMIEKSFSCDLIKTKKQVVKLYIISRMESVGEISEQDCNDILKNLGYIEQKYDIDLTDEKNEIIKLSESKGNKNLWETVRERFTGSKTKNSTDNKNIHREFNEIIAEYRSATFKSLEFERVMLILNEFEKKYQGINLTTERREVIGLFVQEIMNEYTNQATFKRNKFDRTMGKLIELERNHGANLKKEKEEVIKLLVQEIMTEYQGTLFKEFYFSGIMRKLIELETNHGANLKKEKDEVIILLVQEIMAKYRGAIYKSSHFETTMRKLGEIERNHRVNLTKEKAEVKILNDKK